LAASSPSLAETLRKTPSAQAETCPGDNGGSRCRHLVVAPNGVVYVNTWSGRYYGNDKPPAGGFLLVLQDTKGDGHADVIKRFGDMPRTAAMGAPVSPSTTARFMRK
jgi:hypothetical protein